MPEITNLFTDAGVEMMSSFREICLSCRAIITFGDSAAPINI